jgi:Zn-dependent peptidase ImmA (M78 family)
MKRLLARLRETFPFLCTRPATEDDLLTFCSERGIEVLFKPTVTNGFYVVYEGEHFIFLGSKLRGWRLLYVLAHEIGHYLLHVPGEKQFGAECFDIHEKRKKHREAESVAALLLLPIPELEQVLISGSHHVAEEIADLVALRIEIRDKYKI